MVPGVVKSQTRLSFHFSLSCIGEGNGNPLQCSCLENPRDSGAWRAIVHGVAKELDTSESLNNNFMGFTGGTVVKNPPANAGDTGHEASIPGWEDLLE